MVLQEEELRKREMIGEKREKCFGSYVKNNWGWFLSIIFCGVVMAVVMALNGVEKAEIWYGMALCLFFLIAAIAGDFHRYRKKYRGLLGMEAYVTVSLAGLPKSAGGVEGQYQALLRILAEENGRLQNEALRKERDLTEYYTMWVHQIKTPIAALKLLLESKGLDVQQEELQGLFRIEQYVEMALQYMRLGAESTDFVFKKVELDTVVREAVHKYARQFIRKRICLNYQAVNRGVVTDEKWLGFVIEQLLSNAIKYTPSGSISIYMERGRLVVADTGIGIRGEDLPRVCEKGYTGYNGHADKRSTGIGLYLCNSILKKLGHGFTITSEEGSGTQVAISFPNPSMKME